MNAVHNMEEIIAKQKEHLFPHKKGSKSPENAHQNSNQ